MKNVRIAHIPAESRAPSFASAGQRGLACHCRHARIHSRGAQAMWPLQYNPSSSFGRLGSGLQTPRKAWIPQIVRRSMARNVSTLQVTSTSTRPSGANLVGGHSSEKVRVKMLTTSTVEAPRSRRSAFQARTRAFLRRSCRSEGVQCDEAMLSPPVFSLVVVRPGVTRRKDLHHTVVPSKRASDNDGRHLRSEKRVAKRTKYVQFA